jgi:hypothetical protein
VSLGSTAGLRAADDELAASLARAGASVAVARAVPPAQVRTLALTDYVWARAARAAARSALARDPTAVVLYSTITAALFGPVRGAIRFDALAAINRPARHGLWQRPLERRRLTDARLLIPWSESSLEGAPLAHAPAIVVPVAVAASGPPDGAGERDIAAITYAADPDKKGLERVLAAWARGRRDGEELVVAGLEDALSGEGVSSVGRLPREEYRALLRRARLFITAPRREDYGIAQLEALADGCLLITSEAPGVYVALEIARQLDARLVGEDLALAIRVALDDPLPGYAAAAALALAPFRTPAVDRLVAEQLLPALTAGA